MSADMDIYLVAKIVGALGTILGALAWCWKYVVVPVRNKLVKINDTWDTIAAEFKANGGGSMKDALNRIETRQLIESQEGRALTNDTIFGIWRADEKGRFTSVNRTYERMVGMSKTDLTGWNWLNVVHCEDRHSVLQDWEQAIQHEREWYREYRVTRPDGTEIQVISVGHPLFGGDSKLRGYIGQLVAKSDSDDVFFSVSL